MSSVNGPVPVNDPLWDIYVKKATPFDERIIEDWNKIVDVTLVFVGLIMAVLTSFVIDTSQRFQPNPADITNQLLIGIYDQLVAQASNTSSSLTRIDTVAIFKLDTGDYNHAFLCNALLYSSLGLCTVAAALALAAKLWVISYGERASSGGTPYERAKKRQEAYSGVLVWKMGAAIQSLPLILLIALVVFVFFVHISTWSMEKTIGYGVGTLLTLSILALGVTSLAAAFIPACPYNSTFSAIIKGTFDRIHKLSTYCIHKLSTDASCGRHIGRWGRRIIIIISWFASGSLIAWATIKFTSAYYSLVFIPIAITFEYAMKKRVNHNPQKHRLPRLTLSVFILIGGTLAAAGYFRNPRKYLIFVGLYVGGMSVLFVYGWMAGRMSKSLEPTAEIEAIIWLLSLETPPDSEIPDLFEKLKTCRIISDPSDCDSEPKSPESYKPQGPESYKPKKSPESYKPKMLESLMPLLSSLIVSDRSDIELEPYVSFLAYLADFENKQGSWWRVWEDAMSHPRLEKPLLPRLEELAKHQSPVGEGARNVLYSFRSKGHKKRQISGDSDTPSMMTFVGSAHSYEEMELHPRRKGGYYSVDA
ncbi:hypothetical protein K443DRAFT_5912 [Laccaria amethystina LaAM-08-1]|uniref:DUF6535 domain-containing protein n=1 Tax=Laccaria amethystina LaAM-08-1 TaxID=1095629 RepID=A0A0C9XD11_9AGAR|nr:hypothetical protein K443DRAFT_5912 [Laccaria amethystina LaAM-08-1]